MEGPLVIKLRIMRLAEHLARMGDRSGVYMLLVRKLVGQRHFEDLDIRWKIIINKSVGRAWSLLIWPRVGKSVVIV
jgi:hypothetical protein